MKDDFLYSSLFNASFAYYVIKLSFPLKYSNNKICLNKKYNRIASSHQVIKDIITSEILSYLKSAIVTCYVSSLMLVSCQQLASGWSGSAASF